MKKAILLSIWLLGSSALFAQNEQALGDTLAANGNYSGAAVIYRICMKNNEQCALKLSKLIFDNKVEAERTDDLFPLIEPVAKKGNPEAQYYLSMMYKKGVGGVQKNDTESLKWLQMSAVQNYAEAQNEIILRLQDQQAQQTPIVQQAPVTQQAPVVQQVTEQQAPIVQQAPNQQVVQAVTPAQSTSSERKPNLYLDTKPEKSKSGLTTALFVIGGVAAVGGTAATYLLPPTKSEDWSNSNTTNTFQLIEKRNPIFMIAGIGVGAVCIGTGFIVKKKANTRQNSFASEPTLSQPLSNNDLRFNLIAVQNGAGLRLTF